MLSSTSCFVDFALLFGVPFAVIHANTRVTKELLVPLELLVPIVGRKIDPIDKEQMLSIKITGEIIVDIIAPIMIISIIHQY